MIDSIYLIDTDTLSYILKRLEPAYSNSQAYLHDQTKFGISSITYYECVRGYKAVNATRRLQVFYEFLDLVEVFEVDQDVLDQAADMYATLRPRGIFPGEFDALIGATALVHHLPCVTNNTAHYQRFHDHFGLEIHNWMEKPHAYPPQGCSEGEAPDICINHERVRNDEQEDGGSE
jgi:predicted nucleic acid-binding protein